MTKYKHLNLTEREFISILMAEGNSLREIARKLNRSASTLSREIQQNAPSVYKGYYLGHKAQERAEKRKSHAHQRPRLKNPSIIQYVEDKLKISWSPEQIAGRISLDHPGFSISHEAVYQYIYKEHHELIPCLARAHRKRSKRGHTRKHQKSHIPGRVSIDNRPAHIQKRKQAGHWESDTMISKQHLSALLVLVERKSRLTKMKKLQRKTAQENKNGIVHHLRHLPPKLRKSITYDNGSENTEHKQVNVKLGTRSYFCNPYHSWEKGTVENTIGLIRRFFPKKADFSHLSPTQVRKVEFLLNTRPRKCLNYLTPIELLANECCT